ncbi:hypothetical protein [Nocardioides marmoribigeumensis]|uniref:Antitoxin n=2 Tax=Nocardioides marmoribigeumensis TaxID=433649 RepID=A0ABU2C0Z9_9ACTN|nr:hypothetical protein [Nocardioides marmoribigeumensis]MDR7364330.1 hypothetical protein [Nocardioides marmoribigeumensis]
MAERGVSFKQALNDAIRAGARPRRAARFATRTRAMGTPSLDLDKALALAGEIEDDELVRRLRQGQ